MSDDTEKVDTGSETPSETPATEEVAAPAETPSETPQDAGGAAEATEPSETPAPAETDASRTGYADKGLRAGDACTCPDGRKGTVHQYDAGLICIPNQDQGE